METKNINIILFLIAGLVIGGVVSFVLFGNLDKEKCPEFVKMPQEEVSQNVLKFINENLLQGQATASIANIVEEGNLYKITLDIEGQSFDSYATLDGKVLFPEGIKLEEVQPEEPEEPEEPGPESLENFAKCLADKGMKFYGAEWCGWCKTQKELIGETGVQLLYIECIDQETNELTQECKDAGISGFPTWQLPGGQMSSGYKELEQLAELSGCSIE